MVETNTLKIYRNSSVNGEALPLEILLSKGLIKQAFTAAAVDNIALPADTEIMVIYGDLNEDCYVQLDAAAALPANGTFEAGMHFIPAACIKTIDTNGATIFGVISGTGRNGTVIVECAYAYKDARRAKQHSNI